MYKRQAQLENILRMPEDVQNSTYKLWHERFSYNGPFWERS